MKKITNKISKFFKVKQFHLKPTLISVFLLIKEDKAINVSLR